MLYETVPLLMSDHKSVLGHAVCISEINALLSNVISILTRSPAVTCDLNWSYQTSLQDQGRIVERDLYYSHSYRQRMWISELEFVV